MNRKLVLKSQCVDKNKFLIAFSIKKPPIIFLGGFEIQFFNLILFI